MRLSHLASVNGKLVPDTDDLEDMHANIFERNRKQPPKHTRIEDEDLPNSQKLFKNIQKKTMQIMNTKSDSNDFSKPL